MRSRRFFWSLNVLRASAGISKDPVLQCLAPRFTRAMATETQFPRGESPQFGSHMFGASSEPNPLLPASEVLTTIYQFPTMEPLRFEYYPAKHLHLPLRRDILHRAVVFEGDASRQGTASSKTRWEVHGSHRKIRPQKGQGMARLGTKQSPLLRGGGKSFGPKPRDFATGLPRKIYDLAWRTALSYRYRKGELIICEDGMEISNPEPGYVKKIFEHNRWGKEHGKSLVVTESVTHNLFSALRGSSDAGRVETVRDVDVKDLLGMGRLIIEKGALDRLIREHRSDLGRPAPRAA